MIGAQVCFLNQHNGLERAKSRCGTLEAFSDRVAAPGSCEWEQATA